ncbi:MAG: four helix bundle protein, partial [Flavobacteriales bacterium]
GRRKSEGRRWETEDGSFPKTMTPRYRALLSLNSRLQSSNILNQITMKFKFEKLIIWQKAMDLGEEVNTLAYSFPKMEIFNLSSQMRRAVDSVALNISEGSIGQSNPEARKFMGYSIRSLAEVVTCLHKAKRGK